MVDSEKIALINTMIGDFWEYHNDAYQEKCAFALLTAIATVTEFKGCDEGV